MTYLQALQEAESALQLRINWYCRTRGRASRRAPRRTRLEAALERVRELIAAARETGL